MSCEYCKGKKQISSHDKEIYAELTDDGKFRVHELARYDRGIDDSRWVNVHSEFQIKFCPMCGDKI